MKTNKLFIFSFVLLLLGFFITGCDKNMPVVEEVGVESVTLKEELSGEIIMEAGSTLDIARQVDVFPENATDRAESYYSSNIDIATVNARGHITANASGTCEITISVGDNNPKSTSFTLTVLDKVIIPITEITLAITELELMTGVEYNLAAQAKVVPLNANVKVIYESSRPDLVSVSEAGILKGISIGTGAVITVSSEDDPSIKATLPVTVIQYAEVWDIIDKPMTAWDQDGGAAVNRAWEVFKGGSAATTIQQHSGYANFTKTSTGATGHWAWFRSQLLTAPASTIYTVEVKARVNQYGSNQISVRLNGRAVSIYLSYGDENSGYLVAAERVDGERYSINTSEWHVYRIILSADGQYYDLYIDGDTEPVYTNIPTYAKGDDNGVYFGAEGTHNCNIDIEYVKMAKGSLVPFVE